MRSRGMDTSTQTLLIVGACGALAVAGIAALTATGLRIPSRTERPDHQVVIGTDEVFQAAAPAYPTWAPEPLYPQAEPNSLADYSAAFDDAMSDARHLPQPVEFRPPTDLPPPYEVRMESERRPAPQRPNPQHVDQARPPEDGTYVYRGLASAPPQAAPVGDDRSRY